MSKFNWPFEISGFGGEYEQACRDMAEAGAETWNVHSAIKSMVLSITDGLFHVQIQV